MKGAKPSARRRAREFVLQALYQWQIAGQSIVEIEKQFAEAEGFSKADGPFFTGLFRGASAQAKSIEAALQPHLDRAWGDVSPVERGILLLAGYELISAHDVPYRVVINEAIELARSYGGTDGHKYVNGVLDKLAAAVRAEEISFSSRTPKQRS